MLQRLSQVGMGGESPVSLFLGSLIQALFLECVSVVDMGLVSGQAVMSR